MIEKLAYVIQHYWVLGGILVYFAWAIWFIGSHKRR